MRAPLKGDASGLEIALAGVPWDAGSPNRAGSRHAPAQMREMSRLLRKYNFVTRMSPFDQCRIADVGDAPVNPFDVNGTLRSVEMFISEILAKGAAPLITGGDNLISLPVLRAVARSRPVALIHFDAHPDTMDVLLGQAYHSGSPFRRATEEGLIDPKHMISIGIRGPQFSADDMEFNRRSGMTVVTIDDYYSHGSEWVVALVRRIVGNMPVHLTFDIDALDPVYAPGTGGPEPGGLSTRDCQVMIRGFRGLDFVGADINEVSPPLDPMGLTSINACSLMFEMLCVLADSVVRRRTEAKSAAYS